jgi:hypothetical protein
MFAGGQIGECIFGIRYPEAPHLNDETNAAQSGDLHVQTFPNPTPRWRVPRGVLMLLLVAGCR